MIFKFFLLLFFYLHSRAGIEDSKKWGMMFLSNQLFKIYFKVCWYIDAILFDILSVN